MQKGTVLNLRQFNSLINYLKANWCLLTLTLMFLFGISFGIFESKTNSKLFELAKKFTDSFLEIRGIGDFGSVFLSSLGISFAFLLLIFIFGTSVTGVTVVPILTFVRGVIFGFIVSVIYSQFSFKGIAFNALILIPPTIVSVIFLIIGARESIKLSLNIINITLPETAPKNLNYSFKIYCKRYLLLIIPIIISALLDAWLSTRFISVFNL